MESQETRTDRQTLIEDHILWPDFQNSVCFQQNIDQITLPLKRKTINRKLCQRETGNWAKGRH